VNSLTDSEREARIEELGKVLVTSTNLISRARAWNEMRALIVKLDLLSVKTHEQEKQMDMARNIGQLEDKKSKR